MDSCMSLIGLTLNLAKLNFLSERDVNVQPITLLPTDTENNGDNREKAEIFTADLLS